MNIASQNLWIYALLSELSYRRPDTDFGISVQSFDDAKISTNFSGFGNLSSIFSNTENLKDVLNKKYDLKYKEDGADASGNPNLSYAFDVSNQNGILHIYNEAGFSAFVVQVDDRLVVTFRGSDASALLTGSVIDDAAQSLLFDRFESIGQIGTHPQHADEGGWFANFNVASGTYKETQYINDLPEC